MTILVALLPILLALTLMSTVWWWSLWMVETPARRDWIVRHPILHPNAISYMRLPLGIIGTVLVWCGYPTLALLVFAKTIMTDATDGIFARSCGLVSERGKWLDPFADKCVYFPPLLLFVATGRLSPALIGIIFLADLGSQLVRPLLARLHRETAANNFGKLKTISLFALILMVIESDMLGAILPIHLLVSSTLAVSTVLAISSLVFKFIPKKQYANILSTLNLLSGILAILLIVQGRPIEATVAVLAGQLFDLFDGRMARLYGGTRIGPWLDDFADGVSFGMVPAIFFIDTYHANALSFGVGILYGLAVFYRLARFVLVDKKNPSLPAGIFSGLPSPAGALLAMALCLMVPAPWIGDAGIITISALMVSRIRFAHFRHMVERKPSKKTLVFVSIAVIAAGIAIVDAGDGFTFGAVLLGAGIVYLGIARRIVVGICRSEKEK